ncbi:helix-turn-helix domain-containing protein [Rubinisphaera italica]|uniref:Anaerobic benzoate catabolism transcriptional regulator n=1 Tax=Rubinisphaera italica TaxID=2527969 RepID=A0A5C5XBQ2_9PLAN|nr:helix-turn-helix transcriptional regulator [Rubinisphaera italica]TWT59713.1 anaerobic benzoate catabolism transcriptional regulator [Rubinisphaera italica]
MAKQKQQIQHAAVVNRFAARLRELRSSRGMTQKELAQVAQITPTYVWRLETGKVAPGIDLIERLAKGLQTTIADLIPETDAPQSEKLLRQQARKRFDELLDNASKETLLMLNPLLARLCETSRKSA